jgi:hypothetical protein
MATLRNSILLLSVILFLLTACSKRIQSIKWPLQQNTITGTAFYNLAAGMNWKQRDSLALMAFAQGNVPSFLKKFSAIHTSVIDNTSGKTIKATYYVSPDYFSIGSDKDWARICITPQAAQKIADSLQCFLPTAKIVDDIYKAATIKLTPVPLFAYRDSSPVMWQHHLIIEGQRRQQNGLIAGIKKDVVISGKITKDSRPNRVAIYGWHTPDGKPIQPLYTGHVNWYVDYSQGIRLVYQYIKVDGKWIKYTEILNNPLLKKLLCNEELCNFYRYD